MLANRHQPQIFLFNIGKLYRPGLQDIFEYGRSEGYVNGRYKAAYTIPLLSGRIHQNTLYKGLEGIFGEGLSTLDVWYMFGSDGGDSDFATINWANPSAYQALKVNTPLYTNKLGFTAASGTSSHLNSTYSPSAGVNFTQNSGGIYHYVNTDGVGGSQDYGVSNSASAHRCIMNAGGGGNACFYSINRTTVSTIANVNSIGFYQLKRTGSSATSLFKNGASLTSAAVASTGVSVNSFFIGAENAGGTAANYSSRQLFMWGIGAHGNGQEAALNTLISAYKLSLAV